MSTGLTYVTVLDPDAGQNPTGGAGFIFSDYDEAYDYGRWLTYIYPTGVVVAVYTTGPNQSGFWYNSVFNSQD
jgi:hypothetical protein